MKGLIFTELMEMVEDQMGFSMVDTIIERAQLPSQGVYTSVGTYPFEEMVAILKVLQSETGKSIPELLQSFGHHLFKRFTVLYTHFFDGKTTAFDFLMGIEDYIHVEVLKLYPDAQLPSAVGSMDEKGNMVLIYRSERMLSSLALGLIEGCIEHYGERITVGLENIDPDGKEVQFTLTKL